MNDVIDDMFGDDDELDPERAMDALGDASPSKWEGTLLTMLQSVRLGLKREGLSAEDIDRMAPVVAMELCTSLGGGVRYIPRGEVVRRALRDARLYDDHVGTPTERGLLPPALAKKYRLAVQTVYEIIARQKAVRRRESPDLFGFGEGEKE